MLIDCVTANYERSASECINWRDVDLHVHVVM